MTQENQSLQQNVNELQKNKADINTEKNEVGKTCGHLQIFSGIYLTTTTTTTLKFIHEDIYKKVLCKKETRFKPCNVPLKNA